MENWDRKFNETDAIDDEEDNATAHFTACVALLKFEPCPHSTHGHHHGHPCGCCLFDLISSFYLFTFVLSVFLFPSSTSATSSSRSSTRRSWKTCATPPITGESALTTSSTSPQIMSPKAMTSTSSRTHQSHSFKIPAADQGGVSVSQLSSSVRIQGKFGG